MQSVSRNSWIKLNEIEDFLLSCRKPFTDLFTDPLKGDGVLFQQANNK
jgi:hypothetical protein